MVRPLVIVGVLAGAIGVVCWWFSSTTSSKNDVVVPQVGTPAGKPNATAEPVSPSAPADPTAEPRPGPVATVDPTAAAAPPVTDPPSAPLPAAPAVVPAPTPTVRQVDGVSPCPVGGKPTGPFDLAWSFTVGDGEAHGSITVTPLSTVPQISVQVVALGQAALAQPVQHQVVIPKGEARSFPVTATLGKDGGSLVVTVTALGADRRARTVAIDLVPTSAQPATAPASGPALTPRDPAAPVSGTQTIRDESGALIELTPSTTPTK